MSPRTKLRIALNLYRNGMYGMAGRMLFRVIHEVVKDNKEA